MKKQIFAGALAVLMVGLVASACDDGATYDRYPPSGQGDPCNQYASCGTCTPVNGCGWCATGPAQGVCASDPDECSQAPSFSWTWNATGCFVPAEAGVTPVPEAGSTDAGPGLTVDSGPSSEPIDGGTEDADGGAQDSAADAATG